LKIVQQIEIRGIPSGCGADRQLDAMYGDRKPGARDPGFLYLLWYEFDGRRPPVPPRP